MIFNKHVILVLGIFLPLFERPEALTSPSRSHNSIDSINTDAPLLRPPGSTGSVGSGPSQPSASPFFDAHANSILRISVSPEPLISSIPNLLSPPRCKISICNTVPLKPINPTAPLLLRQPLEPTRGKPCIEGIVLTSIFTGEALVRAQIEASRTTYIPISKFRPDPFSILVRKRYFQTVPAFNGDGHTITSRKARSIRLSFINGLSVRLPVRRYQLQNERR